MDIFFAPAIQPGPNVMTAIQPNAAQPSGPGSLLRAARGDASNPKRRLHLNGSCTSFPLYPPSPQRSPHGRALVLAAFS